MFFNKINIIGFGSIINETEFDFNRPGINVIRGKIGSGKTTLISALYWALYGIKLKEKSSINTWDNKKPANYQGTKVEIEININNKDYKIIRCENYEGKIDNKKDGNGIFLKSDNKILNLGKGKRDQQIKLEELLGFSAELFKNAIIFGQKLKRIIEETGPKKKQIFEEAFNVTYIQEALDIVKVDLIKNKSSHTGLVNNISNLKSLIKSGRKLYKTQKHTEQNFSESKAKVLKMISDDMHELKSEQSKLLKFKDKFSDEALEKAKEEFSILSDFIKNTQKRIDKINLDKKSLEVEKVNLSNDKCSYCGKLMKASKIRKFKEVNDKSLAKLKKELDKIQKTDLVKKSKDLSKWQKKIDKHSKISEKIKKLEKINGKIELKNQQFKREKEISLDIESTKTKIENSLKVKEKANNKKELKKLNKELEIQEWLIKDPLSNNGIKAFILQELISKVNQVLSTYSSSLGFAITFEIDIESSQKDFVQTIELEDGQLVDYYDLSGGQRQLVDTSVALAIHEVISQLKPTNILFMDEPFESLDSDTVEIVSELIQNKSKDKSIFIITHQLSFNPRNSSEINVTMDKKKGQTYIS